MFFSDQRNIIYDMLLGGGFKYFFMFTPKIGEGSHLDEHICQRGWFNHQLEEPNMSDLPPTQNSSGILTLAIMFNASWFSGGRIEQL